MALRVALHHITQYRYDRLIGLHSQLVRLRPAPHCRTPIEAYSLHVHPKEHFINLSTGSKIRDDMFCDPLELRKDSLLGTPGLAQAARTNRVAVANPLGAGVLENPGLMAFLPRLCRELLGQELRLPSVATWWCGGENERQYVLANLDHLVVKPIVPHASSETVFGAQLSAPERAALIARIQTRPYHYVGQEHLPLSTTPTFVDGKLVPPPMVLRSFLVAREDAYVVMPGGLARVAPGPDSWNVSNQTGGVSKDIWVLASEPEQAVSLLPSAERPVSLTRSGGEIPSRVADNLFWLGRYSERMESSARVFREMLLRLLDTDRLGISWSACKSTSMDYPVRQAFRTAARPNDLCCKP